MVFSYARSKEKLKKLARDAGKNARAGTPGEAAQHADALLLAVHWSRTADVLKKAGDLSSKVIVSCSLPMNARNTELIVAKSPATLTPPAKSHSALISQGKIVIEGVICRVQP